MSIYFKLGFKYVPPPFASSDVDCVPCSRGISEPPTSRFGFPSFKPCCEGPPTTLRNTTGCGQANVRIVGGVEASENQIPWQCSIKNSDGSFYGCAASIISCDPVIIISAAHCFDGLNM